MTSIQGIAKGFDFAIGFFLAIYFIFFVIKLIYKARLSPNANDLLKPFKRYYKQLIASERYEECGEVSAIIESLKDGIVPKESRKFRVVVEKSLAFKKDRGLYVRTKIRVEGPVKNLFLTQKR